MKRAPKSVWVTGASSGIGREVALELARRGVTVFASARGSGGLDNLRERAQGLPGSIHGFPCDVTDRESLHNVISEITGRYGVPDAAILNAGNHLPTSGLEIDVERIRALLDVNFMGVVHCLSALIEPMRASGGMIAVVGSVAGYRGLPLAGGYCASKAALAAFCESIHPELAQAGIDLKMLSPGFVRTPLTDKNDFAMPFLMEPEAAAKRIVRALQSRRYETTFPRRFTWLMKLARCLPNFLFLRLSRRLLP